jgi:hypothetical protein
LEGSFSIVLKLLTVGAVGVGTQPLLLTTEKMIDVGLGKREELTIKLAVRDCHG